MGSTLWLAACSYPGEEPGVVLRAPFVPRARPRTDWSPAPRTAAGLRMLASQQGQRLLLHTADGDRDFWVGVNLGSTTPGHSPGELAISREQYRRWFALMADMGVRVVRIYTIHPPHMYEELVRFNEANPSTPLYLIHGIYLPDEKYLKTGNLYEEGPTTAMIHEVRDASAAVHGTLRRDKMLGRAWGTWTADVSRWVTGWLVGVEWAPKATLGSDRSNQWRPRHTGKYFSTHPQATSTESWIAARMDELATHEAAHGTCVPIALVNWPTTDPLAHPQEPLPSEDLIAVDANHVVAQEAWPAGTFASYHAYPYYPDFQLLQPSYSGADPYRAYLQDLQRHHSAMPVMITEFGVPSALGSAHTGSNGRDQGNHTEQDAMAMDAAMLRMFHEIKLAGGLLFSWADEWFKFTWNTLERQAPTHPEQRALWHDPLTNEQHFGLLANDAVRSGNRTVHEGLRGLRRVDVDHDASWLYLTLVTNDAAARAKQIRLGFDIVPGMGRQLPGGSDRDVYDVCVLIDVPGRSATSLITTELDPIDLDGLPVGTAPKPRSDRWIMQRLTLNRPYVVPGTTRYLPPDLLDVGQLVEGSWNPDGAEYNSLSTWNRVADRTNTTINLRLPWSMLAIANPATRVAVVPKNRAPTGVPVSGIGVQVDGAFDPLRFRVDWSTWTSVRYAERLKVGAESMVTAMSELAG